MKSIHTHGSAFSLTAPYYDKIYETRNLSQDIRLIRFYLKKYIKNRHPISLLDLGCGTGAHALALTGKDILVTGLDRSGEMLHVAQEKAKQLEKPLTLIKGDILAYTPTKRFDSVISMFDVLSYMTTDKQICGFFSVFSRTLSGKGIGIFDCWYGPGVLSLRPKNIVRTHRIQDITVIRKKIPILHHETNTVSVRHHLQLKRRGGLPEVIEEVHEMRYFFYPEIARYLHDAGLEILSWGNLPLPLRIPKEAPWSTCFVVRHKS